MFWQNATYQIVLPASYSSGCFFNVHTCPSTLPLPQTTLKIHIYIGILTGSMFRRYTCCTLIPSLFSSYKTSLPFSSLSWRQAKHFSEERGQFVLAVVAHLSTASPSLVCYHLFSEAGERRHFQFALRECHWEDLSFRPDRRSVVSLWCAPIHRPEKLLMKLTIMGKGSNANNLLGM